MIEATERAINRALGAIRAPFRAVLTALRLGTPVQLAQADATAGEQLQAAELMQHYGVTSAPPNGSQMIVVPIGGKTAHGVVIATEHGAYRFKLNAQGEVAIYTDEGDHVYLKRGRVVEIETQTLLVKASTKVRLETPLVETTGLFEADGTIRDLRGSNLRTVGGMRDQYNIHVHHENDVNGNTNPTTQTM
jgi:phage baseplate assembly protein V